MSKFIIKPSFLGKKIMLYNAGFTDVVSIEKVKDEPKED